MTITSAPRTPDIDLYVDDLIAWLESEDGVAVPREQREAAAAVGEAMLDVANRQVSVAEAAMAETLRSHVRTRLSAHTDSDVRDLRTDLRVAVIDLDHGLDIDVDDVGWSLSEAALWLYADIEADPPRLDDRIAQVLLDAAAEIDHARRRDRERQAHLTGAIEVHRPGIGGALLTAGATPSHTR